mgnify:FL=1
MSPETLLRQPCSEIVDDDGCYLGTLIIPQMDDIKVQAEYLGERSNPIMPKHEDCEFHEWVEVGKSEKTAYFGCLNCPAKKSKKLVRV